MHGVAVGSYCE